MTDSAQSLQSLLTQFQNVVRTLRENKTSDNIEHALDLGQRVLQLLPTTSPLYSPCSCQLAECLFLTWERTGAEQKRDLELLRIIGSRVGDVMRYCLPNDANRAWYLRTQQTYYCLMRNLSARLEDDFWDHEHLNTLNAAIVYAKSAWHMLRNNNRQARDTADNLGNLYMSRYLYFGRSGDLDDALRFSTMAVIKSRESAPNSQYQSYHQQAARLSLWSQFEDQPDETDDAIDYMNQVIRCRTWDIENSGVTLDSGSSYAVALGYSSRIHIQASIRHRRRAPDSRRHLEIAASHAQEACRGMLPIDPGMLLGFNDAANAQIQLYLRTSLSEALRGAVEAISSALDVSEALLSRRGISQRHGGLSFSGRGGSISSLVTTDNRTSSNNPLSLKERRSQRWIVEALETAADVLLARYLDCRNLEDLEAALLALMICVQGIHGWSSRRPKMLFKLNQALWEKFKRLIDSNPEQVKNFVLRSNATKATYNLWELYRDFCRHSDYEDTGFSPLSRRQPKPHAFDTEAILSNSWNSIVPRGAYDYDLKLSTDAPDILTSEAVWSAEHIQRNHYYLDLRVDHLLTRLDPNDSESREILSMWNRLYCSAGASLKRAEMYQRALMAFIGSGNDDTAFELSDLAKDVLGHLELHLLEPENYRSDISHASNLATTIACLWLKHGRDLGRTILVLENGREVGSRHGMNTIRSYGFDSAGELLPQVRAIRDHLRRPPGAHEGETPHLSVNSSRNYREMTKLLVYYSRSTASLKPFGQQHCMWQARNSFIIHLITSTLSTHAIITTSSGFQKIDLIQCPYEQLRTRAVKFRRAVQSCEGQDSQKGAANEKLRTILAWIWKTIAKPIIQFLHLQKLGVENSNLPRIKWVACGIFSQLPIHAAGIYTKAPTDYMDQYTVSSYMPSIRASLASQQRKPWVPYYQNSNREFTLFGMPTSPPVSEGTLAPLDVDGEKRRIFDALGGTFTNNYVSNCNIGMMRNMMHWARIIHVTCHGLPHPTDPSQSRLVLLNDGNEPCTVAKIVDMDIPNALLLFLSACHSAIDPRASEIDEIVHLAKAFLLAGFPTVVGSLWQAYEKSALGIAAAFYASVAEGWKVDQDEPDADLFPRALHRAVCRWRDAGNSWKVMDWASWICFTTA